MVITLIILWFLIGVLGYIYYLTKDFDFEKSDIPFAFLAGIGGLVSFIVCWFEFSENEIIIKKRK